jgi:hypothetical protein
MLRDVLTGLPGVASWPCDEINYIWRHGNVSYPSDEFAPEMAKGAVCDYISRQFRRIASRQGVETVVEKTCANSLRVEFVDRVLPTAKYVFIRRNGLDAVASAIERWRAPFDPMYVLKKARFVPPMDLAYYGSYYMWNRLYRLFSSDRRLAFWGPRLRNMQDLLDRLSLVEVCALQWECCVKRAAAAFEEIPRSRVIEVSYEHLVSAPREQTHRIASFLGLDQDEAALIEATRHVSDSSVGRGRRMLDHEDVMRIERLAGDTLRKYGYL